MVNRIYTWVNHNDVRLALSLVILGGFLGGLLQPVVAQLTQSQNDTGWISYPLAAMLGITAAGIMVFVIANSKTDNKPRLLFFSLLCGMAFPAVLTSAVDSISKDAQELVDRAADLAVESAQSTKQQEATTELAKILVQNPSSKIDEKEKKVIENSGTVIVDNVAATAGEDDVDVQQKIDQLQTIGSYARTAGYEGTALKAAEKLNKIGETSEDPAIKEEASKAAKRVIEAPSGTD